MDRINVIRNKINASLNPQSVDIRNDSNLHVGHVGASSGGGHFAVSIISDQFSGKSVLERHRMVYQSLEDLMPAEIHALSIKALTPEELS
ncbi:MAG: BolA family protein [Gammaproteobacteria bacterium]|jgi:BolA protein